MNISPVSSSFFTPTTSSSSSGTSSMDTTEFLKVLVAQLKNENPLDPTDTSQFVNQITSYASYNQLVSMSSQLDSVVASMNSLVATNIVGFLGHTVEAYGDTTSLQDGRATWGYSLDSAATKATITVKDADGKTVYQTNGETGAGKHSFTWDGTTSDGRKLTDGTYTIEISATDRSGASVLGGTTVSGRVTGIDGSSGTNMLQIGGAEVSFADIIKITA